MREYAADREHALFVKQADFTEYIYRMECPQMPTTISRPACRTGQTLGAARLSSPRPRCS